MIFDSIVDKLERIFSLLKVSDSCVYGRARMLILNVSGEMRRYKYAAVNL